MSNTERPFFNLDPPSSTFIIGAGGIGCAVGYGLLAAGSRVIFVESNQDKIRWGRVHGIAIDRRKPLHAEFISFDDWDPPSRATVILCTKCYDNVAVLERLPPEVTLVPIQNGFDPSLDGRIKLEGIASFVSECEQGRTQARITRRGKLHFGFRSDTPSASWPSFVLALRSCRLFRTVLVPNILPFKYTKLMYNAAISPLAASAGIDNGQLLRLSAARHLFFELLLENYTILHDANICLGKIGPFHPDRVAGILRRPAIARALAWAFYPTLRGSYCSMTPDLRLFKGRTEIDYYNRHLIELAGDRPCPLNRRVYHLIKQMESERIVPCIDTHSQLSR
ncbi:MAG TPA: ketopantoate reductase C-terminal domain-containing protein [Gemmataceae bacterium]|nr:ketopantoate reductase C-terminal domain-containing protein [Gemmataceae bacterium]